MNSLVSAKRWPAPSPGHGTRDRGRFSARAAERRNAGDHEYGSMRAPPTAACRPDTVTGRRRPGAAGGTRTAILAAPSAELVQRIARGGPGTCSECADRVGAELATGARLEDDGDEDVAVTGDQRDHVEKRATHEVLIRNEGFLAEPGHRGDGRLGVLRFLRRELLGHLRPGERVLRRLGCAAVAAGEPARGVRLHGKRHEPVYPGPVNGP